jgi:hypothetical protein
MSIQTYAVLFYGIVIDAADLAGSKLDEPHELDEALEGHKGVQAQVLGPFDEYTWAVVATRSLVEVGTWTYPQPAKRVPERNPKTVKTWATYIRKALDQLGIQTDKQPEWHVGPYRI